MTKSSSLTQVLRPMSLEYPAFRDGMILTADDLEAERAYHIGRSRMVNRAIFGCGIACGLEVHKTPKDELITSCVCIRPGTAFDCAGDPFELCRPVKLDLDTDPCKPASRVCIVIRRHPSPAPSERGCGCDNTSGEPPQRVREEVEIRVVDANELDWRDVCWSPPERERERGKDDECEKKDDECDKKDEKEEHPFPHCACLMECECCDPCGELWVLLACVDLRDRKDSECGPSDKGRRVIEEIDKSGRRYIKPIRCLCPPKPEREKYAEPKAATKDTAAQESAK
ncbi:hypothetical protein [Ruegeria sp. MALMAid1280]|uniref:hypothetical protein n=1 Tax=Ruegeria sp. MALMAid1280 TaxID=3411634 RepID=UPI003BA2CDE4